MSDETTDLQKVPTVMIMTVEDPSIPREDPRNVENQRYFEFDSEVGAFLFLYTNRKYMENIQNGRGHIIKVNGFAPATLKQRE